MTPDSTALTVGAVNVDSVDPSTLAAWWAAATGGTVASDHGDFAFVTTEVPGMVPMFFQRVLRERPAHNSIHLDLQAVTAAAREEHVQRLVALGATREWDVVGEVAWVDWTTLRDPEGNLFCVGSPPDTAE